MQKYQMRIELMSDMCVSDGSGYNSYIDTDVCYDSEGIPFIPAKRIKGCLREAAVELADWGYPVNVSGLFGAQGNKQGKVRLENAYPEGVEEYREQIQKYRGSIVVHPQNVLKQFTYVRTQTAVHIDTGAADRSSLRTMRVLNKGLVFLAQVQLAGDFCEAFTHCCTLVKHMGVARTRGLGEVKITLVHQNSETQPDHGNDVADGSVDWIEGSNQLEYEILLKEPVVCKNVNGAEENTMDYIEGAKILGLAVQRIKEKGQIPVQEFLGQGELCCSNAYLAVENMRLTEIPATFYSIKNNKSDYVDKIYETEEDKAKQEREQRQLNPMKHCYGRLNEEGLLVRRTVDIEERYHHKRPEDASIGRVLNDGSGESIFYQISAIMAGQTFRGFIQGSELQIKQLYAYLTEDSDIRLGSGRMAEYGKASLTITGLQKNDACEVAPAKEFIIKLEAPAIIYSEQAVYTTDKRQLQKEVEAELDMERDQILESRGFVNYTTVGGFNVTWGMRKPTIEAFDKGTVLYYRLNQETNLPASGKLWIGERVTEGYGEATVMKVDHKCCRNQIQKSEEQYRSKVVDAADSIFTKNLCRNLFAEYLRSRAAASALRDVDKSGWNYEAANPTISNLILICKEHSDMESVCMAAEARFGKNAAGKEEKKHIWISINENIIKHSSELMSEFCQKYQIKNYDFSENEIRFLYIKEYLLQLKYALRKERRKN